MELESNVYTRPMWLDDDSLSHVKHWPFMHTKWNDEMMANYLVEECSISNNNQLFNDVMIIMYMYYLLCRLLVKCRLFIEIYLFYQLGSIVII